jgi:serine protease Do
MMNSLLRTLSTAAVTLCGTTLLSAQTSDPAAVARIEKALQAVMKLETKSIPNARSSATLGDERSGNGVLIENNLVLTIGYLIMEADEIELTDHAGRKLPGVVAGYDHASGFGLVRLLAPSKASPVALGISAGLAVKEPVLAVTHGGVGAAQPAYVVSKRLFTGSWEYMLAEALYTFPPIADWGGAGLFSKDGALVGVGSLYMRDADGEGMPGNMFVPIDLLKPILADMKAQGRAGGAARPWLGMSTEERSRGLTVVRVSKESPAENAGIEVGDIITAVSDVNVDSQKTFYSEVWNRGDAGVTITLKVRRDGQTQTVKVKSVDRMSYLKPRTTL